jgi:cytochrome P450
LDLAIDIYDPDQYVSGPPHDVFERLRREDPVHRQDMPDGTSYWAVLRHRDVVEVSRNPLRFSAAVGGVTLEDLAPESLAMMQDMLLAMDPPRHARHRDGLSAHFRARVIAGLEPRVRSVCRSILASAGSGRIEAVHEVCALVPSQVIGELVGIPEADRPKIHAWGEQIAGGQDPDLAAISADDSLEASIAMAMFAIELAGKRREEPAEDLITLLLGTEVDGQLMTDVAFGSFFVQLVVAGNDTSRTLLSSAIHALLLHPEQLAELRRDHDLIPQAVEEVLRWANPLHYFRRTATEDTELAGTSIAAGDKLAMVYTSANRDAEVFAEPHRFDIHRDPNPHLSFGIGEHFCLGVHLARLEARVFLEEMLDAWTGIELVGEPRRQRSNLNNSLKSLPLDVRR